LNKNTEIVYALIDSQNLNLGIKNDIFYDGRLIYQGWTLDYKKFYFYLRTKYNVSKAFLFIGKVSGNESLYNFLATTGYDLIFKPTLSVLSDSGNSQTKGNVDAELVLHSMIELKNYDKAIIVSGDGDYFCLVEYLKKIGKLAHVFIPNKHVFSSLLRKFYTHLIFVTDLKSSLEYIRK
jgi:uncharacterized LabA/DUF88 family protein